MILYIKGCNEKTCSTKNLIIITSALDSNSCEPNRKQFLITQKNFKEIKIHIILI